MSSNLIGFITEYQAYGYFFFTAALAIGLYWYWYHLYRSEKTGRRNYEQYGKLALDDDLGDKPVESMPVKKSKIEQRGAK
jgi:cytochrome c oxidase cbb3-type subunit 4